MISSDKIKELELEKARIDEKAAADKAALDAKIEQIKNVGRAQEKLTALVNEYKYSTTKEFLIALGHISVESVAKVTKTAKTPRAASTSGTTRGPLSKDDKAKIASLKSAGKSVEEIAKEIKRTVAAVEKVLKG
jgi:hypothetical protein